MLVSHSGRVHRFCKPVGKPHRQFESDYQLSVFHKANWLSIQCKCYRRSAGLPARTRKTPDFTVKEVIPLDPPSPQLYTIDDFLLPDFPSKVGDILNFLEDE